MADLKAMYKTIVHDHFTPRMEMSFIDEKGNRQTLAYEKATWNIDGEVNGLRYGENPGQEAALYRLVNGNLTLGKVTSIQAGQYLASDVELLQSGKHPGKTNITDVDNALNILRYFSAEPTCVIVKHNNPCGVAKGKTLAEAYNKALMADRIAAFGGAIAVNRPMDIETAKLICESYSEVVCAPSFEEGVMAIFAEKKNLRVMEIGNINNLHQFIGKRFVDIKSLIDGGMIMQWSFVPQTLTPADLIPATTTYKGVDYKIDREPTAAEIDDMLFGWLVESGITSNSVIYVKNGATVAIGTGEQDRVGVAEIARDKAFRKYADKLAWQRYQTPWALMTDQEKMNDILLETEKVRGGILGSVMVSDAFFPFRDGIDIGLKDGVTAVIQPGGSIRDFEVIQACNEVGATMKFTGQRSFKH